MKSDTGPSPGVEGGRAVAKNEFPKIDFLHSENRPKYVARGDMEKQN